MPIEAVIFDMDGVIVDSEEYWWQSRVEFAGKRGRVIELKTSDVVVLPAGTGHRRKSASRGLLVTGAYPENAGSYNEPQPKDLDPVEARRDIGRVKLPAKDPVYGTNGAVRSEWRARKKH